MRITNVIIRWIPLGIGAAVLQVTMALAVTFFPTASLACACGCGVFDVGTGSLFVPNKGGIAFLEYDYMDQNQNWSGASSAPAANNDDKEIRTDFMTAGVAYKFNQDWGVMAELPFWNRTFRTASNGSVESFTNAALGDMRLMGTYSGLSGGMSTQVQFGLKVPTGDFHYANFDRDTEIGTGSTDLMLGLDHRGNLNEHYTWMWFGQVMWDKPLAGQGGYMPGSEIDGALGVYYAAYSDIQSGLAISPILQLIGSHRSSDSGSAAAPANSGYNRLMISPGVEADIGDWKLYGDVEFPIYQDMTGNQLVAPVLFKVILSHAI